MQIWENPTFPYVFTIPVGRFEVEPFAIAPSEVNPVVAYTHQSPNRIQVETDTGEDTVLVVSDSWFSGWKVWIDGKRAALGSVSNLLAIPILAGKHTVLFEYAPAAFTIGAGLSVTALLSIAAIIIGEIVRKKRKTGQQTHPIDPP